MITALLTDGTERVFLAKGGEDLRQDARIVRLLRLMAGALGADAACVSRRLTLRTYGCVPLSPRAGLLEFGCLLQKQFVAAVNFMHITTEIPVFVAVESNCKTALVAIVTIEFVARTGSVISSVPALTVVLPV